MCGVSSGSRDRTHWAGGRVDGAAGRICRLAGRDYLAKDQPEPCSGPAAVTGEESAVVFGAAYLVALIAVGLVTGLLTGNWIVAAVAAIGWMVILQTASVLMRALRPRHKASPGDDVPTSKS